MARRSGTPFAATLTVRGSGTPSTASEQAAGVAPVATEVPTEVFDIVSIDVLDTPEAGSQAIRGSAIRGIGYVAGTLITLVSAPLLVRYLGIVQFGRYMTAISLTAIVAGVTDVGLSSLTAREYAVRRGAERDAFMRNVLGTRMLLTASGVGVAALFAAVAGYGLDLVVGTALAGVGLLLGVMGHTIGVPLAVHLRLGWATVADVAAKAVTVGLVVALVVAHAGIVPFLAVPILPGLGTLAFLAMLAHRLTPLRPTLHFAELRPLLRETLPLAVATILSTIYGRIIIILLSLTAAAITTGYFSTAVRVLEVAVGVPTTLVATMFPVLARAARDDHERLRYALQRVLDVALIGGAWMSMALALGAGFVMSVVGGAQAAPAAAVLRVLSFTLLAVFLNVAWQHGLLALRRHREMLIANAVGLVAVVVLTVVLVPRLGASGAGLAAVLAEWSLTIAAAFLLLRRHPNLSPQLRLVPQVAVAVTLALLVGVVPSIHPLLRVAFASVAYFGVLAALGAIPHELRRAVAGRIGVKPNTRKRPVG